MKNITMLGKSFWFFLIISFLLGAASLQAAGESRVKVHKELIAISGPDGEGRVHLTGQPGAIESTSAVEVLILNLSTNERAPLLIQPDGSFTEAVSVLPNQKIRILARNAEKKQSYGTFTIPAAPTTVEVVPVVPTPVSPESYVQPALKTQPAPGLERPVVIAPTPALSGAEATLPVAVYVNVVDQRTGQLLAAQRIEGTIYQYRLAETGYGEAVAKLMERFTVWIERELHHVQITPTKAPLATDQQKTVKRAVETCEDADHTAQHNESADDHAHNALPAKLGSDIVNETSLEAGNAGN